MSELLCAEELRIIEQDILALILEMVDEGELVEVDYVLPNLNYRIKSFLLPKGTEVRCANLTTL